MEIPDQIAAALAEKFEPDDFATLKQASAELAPAVGRLSEADLDAIADRVAAKVVDAKAAGASPEKRMALRRLIKSVAFQIGLNLAASALWELLAYLAHLWAYADSADANVTEHKAKEAAERRKLVNNISPSLREPFQGLLDGAGGALANALIGQSMFRSAERSSDVRQATELANSAADGPQLSSNDWASAIAQQLYAELKHAAADQSAERD